MHSDHSEPTEQPIRARVPDHVAGGAFSTGVIVMTAQTEFILDFVQNLGRPHQIVARVVMPHHVLPQLVDALQRNIELFKSRWGELPQVGLAAPSQLPWSHDSGATNVGPGASSGNQSPGQLGTGEMDVGLGFDSQTQPGAAQTAEPGSNPAAANPGQPNPGTAPGSNPGTGRSGDSNQDTGSVNPPVSETSGQTPQPPHNSQTGGGMTSGARQATAQDIYDDLKIRDEILSGTYANAVMIGHGPHEFSFDFITNFYPSSCVSSRVFLAAGQIPRLLDSLRGTWEQLRARMQPPGNSNQNNPMNPNPPKDPEPERTR